MQEDYMKYFMKRNKGAVVGSRKHVKDAEAFQPQFSSIWQFKVEPTIQPNPLSRPYMGMCCPECQPNSRNGLIDEVGLSLGLRDILQVETQYGRFFKRAFCHLIWVASRNPVVIYPDVIDKVVKDDRVEAAVDRASQVESQKRSKDSNLSPKIIYDSLVASNRRRVLDILRKMAGTVKGYVIRFVSYALHKTLRHLVSAVRVHKGQIEVLKRAEKSGTPIIYLPLHKSHLDYILLTFVLYDYEMRAPLIAAGDNLRLPLVGSFAQKLGAFFIRRRLDTDEGQKDLVYRAVLHSYVADCLRVGHSMEIFIEGGRSRSGKPSIPKAGLLGVIYDTYNNGFIEDALIVPVAMSYELVPDGSFVTEELGQPKRPESFWSVMMAACKLLFGAGGMKGAVRVEFCQPFSLAEYVTSYHQKISKVQSSPIFGPLSAPTSPVPEQLSLPHNVSTLSVSSYGPNSPERRLVDSLARHVVYSAGNSLAATCTGLLSYLFLTQFRAGASLHDIVKAFDDLREEVVLKKFDLAFRGDSLDVVMYAAELLGPPAVRMERSSSSDQLCLVPATFLPRVLELSYYANTVIQVFLPEALLSLALLSNLTRMDFANPTEQVTKSRDTLIVSALQLCDILRYEYIVSPPCQDNEKIIINTMEDFKTKGLLAAPPNEDEILSEADKWAKRVAKRLDWSTDELEDENIDDMEFEDKKLMVNVSRESKNLLSQKANILRPVIDGYCYVVKHVEKLAVEPLEEKILLKRLQAGIMTSCDEGTIAYRETVALDTLKNCLRLLVDWEVLELSSYERFRYYKLNRGFSEGLSYSTILDRVYQFKMA